MRRRSTKHHPNIAEIVQSAQHLELLEVSTFLSIEALRLLPVHDMAFTAQEHVQTPIAAPPLLGSQFAQAKT
jgi:hypothetical protein